MPFSTGGLGIIGQPPAKHHQKQTLINPTLTLYESHLKLDHKPLLALENSTILDKI